MSRHTSRKDRWTKVSAKEYRASFGTVRYRAGAWEGTVVYESWNEELMPPWQAQVEYAGRFKRPRNAMIAVEDKARAICRALKDKVKFPLEDG